MTISTSSNWNSAAYYLSKQGQSYVIATIVGSLGSTPRSSGTKMVICHDQIYDTIGGGHLEFQTIKQAQKMLAVGKNDQYLAHFQLGANLGQCCGGNVSVLFESFAATGVNIMLFGAGHVGKALLPILAQLPCRITWVDERNEQFPTHLEKYHNVRKLVSEAPECEVQNMPLNSYYIVMTHNHQTDFDITQTILNRGDFAYLGLIASSTKWRRFQQRYKHRNIDPQQVARMHCPIGLAQVNGKLPMEVAVSIAAQVINIYQTADKSLVRNQAQELINTFDKTNQNKTKQSKTKKSTIYSGSQQGVFKQEIEQAFKEKIN